VPYFIKNLILLAAMGLILTYVYFVDFMGQEFHVKSVYKVLAGLHSHTFNFLAKHHESLAIDKE